MSDKKNLTIVQELSELKKVTIEGNTNFQMKKQELIKQCRARRLKGYSHASIKTLIDMLSEDMGRLPPSSLTPDLESFKNTKMFLFV